MPSLSKFSARFETFPVPATKDPHLKGQGPKAVSGSKAPNLGLPGIAAAMWQTALQLLCGPRGQNDRGWCSAINACGKAQQWLVALQLLEKMPSASVSPTVFTFSAAISACERGAQWQLAIELLAKMPAAHVLPNEYSFSAAISACEKCGQWQVAFHIFSLMPFARVEANETVLNVAISACQEA